MADRRDGHRGGRGDVEDKKLVPKGTSAYQAAAIGNEGYDDDTELVEIGEDADDEQVKRRTSLPLRRLERKAPKDG